MKETTVKAPSALFTCTCGAMPYDAEKRPKGKVGLARYRKSSRYAKDGGWSVVCTSMQKPDGTQSGTSMAR